MAEVKVQKIRTIGRRKEATARVQLFPGTGKIHVNGLEMAKYFHRPTLETMIRQPIEAVQLTISFDVIARVNGGGKAGQAGAVRLGIARALVEYDGALRTVLRRGDFLTRDPRMKERKKYGQKGARRRFQYSKR